MNCIQLSQHYINLVKGRDYRHSEKLILDTIFLPCLPYYRKIEKGGHKTDLN